MNHHSLNIKALRCLERAFDARKVRRAKYWLRQYHGYAHRAVKLGAFIGSPTYTMLNGKPSRIDGMSEADLEVLMAMGYDKE